MLRRIFSVLVLTIVWLSLTAMGGTGGFERAPRVEKNFAVTVTDATGNKITGEKFSWEGRINFAGYKGMAQVNVPFEKIQELSTGERIERKIRVTAKLTDGSETTFDVDAKTRCYGEAPFGNFMLQMDEIKSIVFSTK